MTIDRRELFIRALATGALLAAPAIVRAENAFPERISKALALTFDVSDSMVTNQSKIDGVLKSRLKIQQEGTADAFLDESIQHLILEVKGGIGVCLNYFGEEAKSQAIEWRFLDSLEKIKQFSEALRQCPFPNGQGSTNVISGLEASLQSFNKLPTKTHGKVIDISGDGIHNKPHYRESTGQKLIDIRESIGKNLIQTNAIVLTETDKTDTYKFYETKVITPEEHFNLYGIPPGKIWRVEEMGDFQKVIQQKLYDEIS